MQPQRSMTERVKLFLAYVIRVISIPPVMVSLLVLGGLAIGRKMR